ncbi:uncharacterized protein N7482_000582 [Penicillium canariense]|uniref:Copper transport protein n=1 Tax=Penicillium canariense TaxID=189055 RepID=A0A9W9IC90_9EURO|nr:uncharacterized protein N7482_000582 [Penicillium canariense]KAJ5174705.1 hypothetical protein N7482_000582 [Penicillium canariense]
MTAIPSMSSNMSNLTGMPNMPGMGGIDMTCQISVSFLSSSWHIRSRGMFAGSCIGTVCLVLCLEFLRRMGREYDAFILRQARLRKMYLSSPISGISSKYPTGKTSDSSDVAVHRNTEDCTCSCPPSASVNQDEIITTIPGMDSSGAKLTGQTHVTSITAGNANLIENSAAHRTNADTIGSYRPSPVEQVIRALLHMVQFAVAYLIMLLAMYYNGYIIICIFVGAFLGSLVFSWEPVSLHKENDATQVTKCCG